MSERSPRNDPEWMQRSRVDPEIQADLGGSRQAMESGIPGTERRRHRAELPILGIGLRSPVHHAPAGRSNFHSPGDGSDGPHTGPVSLDPAGCLAVGCRTAGCDAAAGRAWPGGTAAAAPPARAAVSPAAAVGSKQRSAQQQRQHPGDQRPGSTGPVALAGSPRPAPPRALVTPGGAAGATGLQQPQPQRWR